MCGIIAFISRNSESCRLCEAKSSGDVEFLSLLKSRGPDISHEVCLKLSSTCYLHLEGNVLWTQGDSPVQQPIVLENAFLLFNGDIYSFDNGAKEYSSLPDGPELLKRLYRLQGYEYEILQTLASLHGPFAFIFVKDGIIWFGRDFHGKSSLVFNEFQDGCLAISSLATWSTALGSPTSEEITPGLYQINTGTWEEKVFPWDSGPIDHHLPKSVLGNQIGRTIPMMKLDNKFRELLFEDLCEANLEISDLFAKLAKEFEEELAKLDTLLRASIQRRIRSPPMCKYCIDPCDHTKVAVLFSGGVDSAIIAYLVADTLGPSVTIDLINLAFNGANGQGAEDASDRQTAITTFSTLNKKFPLLNLVLVDIGVEELIEERKNVIRYLIAPLKTVLDDSIGCALYFAGKAKGYLFNVDGEAKDKIAYESKSRILFLGSGADELFGGYSHNRHAYDNNGWAGLTTSMYEDILRIGSRNLGRDNRVISHHGVSPRIPFLDEAFVEYIVTLPASWRSAPCLNSKERKNFGDKTLLRLYAVKLFGSSIALLPKKALQFGSRIARLESRSERGHDICPRLSIP